MKTHAEIAGFIDRHFEATISVEDETQLRAHLPGCASCEARYRRHLLLASLDRRVPTARRRLARGLGLRVSAPARVWSTRALVAATALAALVLIARPHAAEGPRPDTFAARGRGAGDVGFVWIYRLLDDAAPALVVDHVAPNDELAFAYANPAGKRYLAIFAADEHGHIYWYYPSWPAGARPPAAFHARAGTGPFELKEAVRHPLDGHHLELYGVFSDEPLGVDALERASAASRGLPASLGAGDVIVKHALEVRP
jgi:hypothetical protein